MPEKVEALSGLKVCTVAAADDAGCAVTGASELYTWGFGDYALLGQGDTVQQLSSKRVEALHNESVIAMSPAFHTIAATRDVGVFCWGAAGGLGMPHAATVVVVRPGKNDDAEEVCIISLHRNPQLSCVPCSSRAA